MKRFIENLKAGKIHTWVAALTLASLFFAMVFMVGAIVGPDGPRIPNNPPPSAPTPAAATPAAAQRFSSPGVAGAEGVLTSDEFLATTDAAFDKMIEASVAK